MPDARLVLDLDAMADAIAERVVERLGAGAHVDQQRSPLGKNRHCAAVRRRIAAGEPGAAIVGRRHLLSRDALDEELLRAGRPAAATSPPRRASAQDDAALLSRLGLRRAR
ncbi:MAG TPA: hypothetical protein PLN42_11755 [Anaerolineae bacterium]|nr:hypothetical protein [Anaerolineae bacterium]